MMMVYEPLPSNPILPLSDDKAAVSASRPSLAPGFRFHPTDEELVSYYLKRKVKGLSLRVDAIAELDLYKKEPWELPHYSRLRSRDKEWYFFSPLDRKYSNRNRTNRATAAGYWKTTGKDRPVRHANKLVGMKKTLVFHAGRAPRGKRTNWVMHEYRMEDEDEQQHLDPNLLQASFVVCRIFEKNGTGPQNGAQYGAPFVEEEWEEEVGEELIPLREAAHTSSSPDGVFMDPRYSSGEQDSVHSDDVEQKLDLVDQHENTAIVAVESEGKEIRSHSEDPTISLEDILNLNRYDNEPGQQDAPNMINNLNMEEKSEIGQQSHSPSDRNDGYMELRDILDNVRMDCPHSGPSFDGVSLGVDGVDQIIGSGVKYETTTLPEIDGTEFNFDIENETAIDQELSQMCTQADGIFDLQSDSFLNPVAGHYPSSQLSEDSNVFYDAPSSQPPYAAEDNFVNSSDFQFSPTADLPGFDMVDEFMAYFDATDNNLQYDILDSPVKSEFVPEVEGSSYSTCEAARKVPETNIERDASSSARFQEANNQLAGINEDDTVAPDIQADKGWNNSLRKRVVNMLGSISAPPAMAQGSVKGKGVVGVISAAQSSCSIHVSAGIIQIHGITVMGSAERWTLQKNGDMSFFLSYGMSSDNDYDVGKSVCFEPFTKLHGGLSAMLLRGGFYLFGISALILSVSYKVVMCVYNK